MSIEQQSCVEAMKHALEVLESQRFSKVIEATNALRQAIAEAAVAAQHKKQSAQHCVPHGEPVLVVEKEPDYMSGGHFHTGTKPHIDPTKVWSLPIGTKLYIHPYTGQPKENT
jgi:hypothetical protein